MPHNMLSFMEGIILARPSFKIDPVRLRGLREESKLTQLQVANEVHILLGKRKGADDHIILNVYQRIEHTGKTSKKTAHAIAQVLDVSVQILQGEGAPEDSADIISQIRRQLQEQRDSAKNQTLLDALKKYASTDDSLLDEDTILNEYAIEIAKQIEVTQIGQDSNEIARLVELTGWSKAQLQELGGIDGHWLLLTRSRVSHETEVVQGISNVMARIYESFNEMPDIFHHGDARITISKSLPWFHVEVTPSRYDRITCKFSFVRCKANVDGLKWVNPTWRDEFMLDYLKDWAFRNTNFFTDVDGKNYPEDLRRLRLQVVERNIKSGIRQVAYSKGHLEELPENVLQNFKTEGNSHSLVTSWLTSGFAQGLAPRLHSFPRECWEICANTRKISIYLDIPVKLWLTNKELVSGNKFTINLVEETSPGIYRPVPWQENSVKEVVSALEREIFKKYDEIDHEYVLQFNDLPYDDTDIEPSTEEK